jgi:hypothetical protein
MPKARFIPLALAIDLDMTPPIGSITTTTIDIGPVAGPVGGPTPARPSRRHLRLL